jgi:hypothetical protein
MPSSDESKVPGPNDPNAETLVNDVRDNLWPAEMVDRRLEEMRGVVNSERGPTNISVSGRRPERSL